MIYPEKLITPCVDAYLSIILSDDDAMVKAIMESFIGCFSDGDSWSDYMDAHDYGIYGTFRGFRLTSDFIKMNFENLHTIIDNSINNNYYIIYNVDTYYVENYKSYHERHFIHPIFIVKRTDDRKNYVCRDYYDFVNYSEEDVKCSDLDQSFEATYCKEDEFYNCVLTGVKLDPKPMNAFDGIKKEDYFYVQKMMHLLEDFLAGTSKIKDSDLSYLREENKIRVGIEIFDGIRSNLERSEYYLFKNLKIKPYKLIEHHIYMMKKRIEICSKILDIDGDKSLNNWICGILKDAELLFKLVLKYNVTKNETIIPKIIFFLDKLKKQYTECINSFISELK